MKFTKILDNQTNYSNFINFNGYFIYQIINTINNKMYIGQAVNFKRRIYNHIRLSKLEGNYPIHKAIKKYGLENFKFIIISIARNASSQNLCPR